jgi:hypothetical protein
MSRRGRTLLRTLGTTTAAVARTTLETLTTTGLDDYGTGYGPGTGLVSPRALTTRPPTARRKAPLRASYEGPRGLVRRRG